MQRYTKSGEEYMKIVNAPAKVLKLGKIKVNLQDLFKDKVLNEVTNAVINQNPYLFVDDFTPKISNSICELNEVKYISLIFMLKLLNLKKLEIRSIKITLNCELTRQLTKLFISSFSQKFNKIWESTHRKSSIKVSSAIVKKQRCDQPLC